MMVRIVLRWNFSIIKIKQNAGLIRFIKGVKYGCSFRLGINSECYACLKAISSTLKSVKEIDQKIALHSVHEQLVELQERLLDARDQTSELISQNQELRQQLTIKEEIQHQEDGNILWRIVGGQNKGPYCSTCYGAENKLISLSGNDPGAWHCPKCKNHFHTRQ